MKSARCISLCLGLLPVMSTLAGPGAEVLPVARMLAAQAATAPVTNAAFAPGADAQSAPAFEGTLRIAPAELLVAPALEKRLVDGRDAQAFPGVRLQFLTLEDGTLAPLERGTMVTESSAGKSPSYWNVIPQFGRVWREKADGDWSRAAFPLMLVNDTENHAHQGLATLLYRGTEVSAVELQFVQQNAPYLLSPTCQFWGTANRAALRAAAGHHTGAIPPRAPPCPRPAVIA